MMVQKSFASMKGCVGSCTTNGASVSGSGTGTGATPDLTGPAAQALSVSVSGGHETDRYHVDIPGLQLVAPFFSLQVFPNWVFLSDWLQVWGMSFLGWTRYYIVGFKEHQQTRL